MNYLEDVFRSDMSKERIFKSPEVGPISEDSSLGHWLLRQFDIYHDKVLLIDGVTGREWTGASIADTVKSYATGLIKLIGIQPQDICCISYDNCDTTILLALAIIVAGGVVCCPFPLDPYPELLYLARKTEPRFLFCHSKNQSWAKHLTDDLNIEVKAILMDNEFQATDDSNTIHIDEIFNAKHEDDSITLPVDLSDVEEPVAFITMSSGTTGRPKAIPTTHKNCLFSSRTFVKRNNTEVYSCSATLDYASARIILLGAIEAGYTAVIMNSFELNSFLEYITKYKISVVYLGVAAFHSLINYSELYKYDISSLKVIFPMGGKIPSFEDLAQFLRKHSHIQYCIQGYGSSEISGCALNKMPVEQFINDPMNCGTLLKNVQLKVVDPDSGALLGHNEKGLLYVKSPSTFKGYYDASHKYNTNGILNGSHDKIDYRYIKFQGDFDEDDFYNTGDLGYMNDKEELFCLGRMKELMTCRGCKKVLPQELEEIIQELPIVAEVTVLGIPSKSDIGIDCPRAFIVLNFSTLKHDTPDSSSMNDKRCHYAKQINDHVNGIIGWEKQLTGGIVILDEIPRLRSTGKVNKTYLKGLKASNELKIYMDQSE